MNLTKPQKLIYDMEKFAGGAISVICGSVVYKGNKSIDDLQNAVNKMFCVNDALRIRIKENDGNPYQTITIYQEQKFEVLNFSTEQELNSYAENYAKEPIDLYGSLCDAKIIILPDSYGIIIKMHHLIGDAWTLALLGSQFNELLNGNEVEAYSYKEYVTSEEKYANTKRYEKDKSFFLEQFKKCDEATYISEKQADTFNAKRKTFIINKENTKNIVDYTNKNNSSVFTLFMTALGIYFNRTHMNSEKFYIGTAVLNRTGFKEKNTAGMFINTVPVLIDLENEKSFLANVENVQNSVLSTLRHQKYNYGDILTDIRKECNFTEKLYDVMLSYQNAKITGVTESFESKWYHSGCQGESLQIHIDDRDSEIHIVDKYMQPTPIGVTGELCISGDCVGAGYLNRPELTAEKFIDNPFGKGKLYKTGDLAYWREDGNIVYVGRNDFQVKIRGLRIELGEIENAISSIYGISQAVVVVRKNTDGRQLICAFYTGNETDAKKIRSHIGKKLPKYMLPHIFTHLNEMPITSSGKVNRKVLPDVDLENISNDTDYVAPTTEKQKIICSCIERLLNVSNIGIKDNFIDLGGDSLKAIELVSKLLSDGYSVSVKDILNSNNIEELENNLIIEDDSVFDEKYTGDVLATPAQMRVYTAQSINENSTMYNVPYAFKVENIDVNKLQSAIDKMLFRHDILKTQFENIDGNIVQIVNKNAECKIEILNSGNIADFIRPFNLSKAPLIRVGVYKNTVMIDMHHIITDGSSMPIFFNELNELYVGNELNDKAVQYKEFAIKKFDCSKSEEYWLSVYSDEVPVLEINTDYPRGRKQLFNGDSIYNQIDIDLHNKIKSKCRELGITPYVYYMSGFNILLSKFSSNEDIAVGMPVSGRKAEYLNTIGMFVNTIALRNKPAGTKTIEDFLNEVKNNSLNAIENQDYPFGELVKKLNIEAIGRNPLFDVMFAYQSESMTDIIFNNIKAKLLPIPITTSKYDFTFNIMPRDNDVVLMVEYCTDLYKEHTIQRFINGYKLILTQMLDTNKSIKELFAITENEQQLLFDFNDTVVDYPKDKCVHQLFEEQVAKTPNKIALIACDKTLTYAELNEQANRIAHSLIEMGIGISISDIVAFMLPRKSYLIATMLGILKSGAAYLPIDPDYPQDRIEYMLSDSNAKLFITESNIEKLLNNQNTANPDITMSSEDLCYCIYTSGSTGNPKGTLLKHQGIVNLVTNLKIYNNLSNCNRFGFMTTITFDVATQEIFTALLNGFTGVFMSERKETRADEIIDGIVADKVDVMYATPTYFESLTDTEEKTEKLFNTIKVVCLAGEKFYLNHNALKYKEQTDLIFENQYGPVELHVIATATTLRDNDFDSIGKPVGNDKAYIVDQYMQPTPIGVTGELCIAGDGVGAGYLNRPELTAEKFIDNPFGEGKLYKTGDLAYWREDGNIAYVGRNDFQVKIRGLRIELGEIENAISSFNGISQAVVVVRKNTDGRQLICAFYVGQEYDAKDIRNIIGKKLPKYMLPHIFTHLDEMPLTSSGKVNRKALPEVDLENICNDTEYVAPETNQQKLLCKTVEKVLGIDQVGLSDDFFDLGGDSLKAIEFVSKAHNEGIYFSLQNVFDYPTVNLLCEFLANNDIVHNQYNLNDFEDIHSLLMNNFKCDFVPEKNVVGDVLLTGATGFLGIHILAQFIENESGKIYCIVRGKSNEDSLSRLGEQLKYYFEDRYLELLNKRIIVLCGDIQKANFGINNIPKVDMVINAAASVKHFGSYKYFYDINVGGTINALKVAETFNAKLIQISTLSVSGNSMADIFDAYVSESNKTFSERNLYIEQPLDNVYIRSKFEAEVAVYNEMLNGLKANIIRVGNLTNRSSDLKFQPNYQSNAFLLRVKAVLDMGMIPDYLLDLYSEFSPVDDTANAIIKIAQHFNDQNIVFHVNNHNNLYFDRFIELANKMGIPMQVLAEDKFAKNLSKLGSNPKTQYIYEALINDMDKDGKLVYDSNIHIENDLTVEYLKKIGFDWSKIDYDYLKAYVEYFNRLGYLEV